MGRVSECGGEGRRERCGRQLAKKQQNMLQEAVVQEQVGSFVAVNEREGGKEGRLQGS